MKEIPILFSTPMVQAILGGRKTMTRRIIEPQPIIDEDSGRVFDGKHKRSPFDIHNWKDPFVDSFSRWMPGDLLWVRESFSEHEGESFYKADSKEQYPYFIRQALANNQNIKWRPSIFLPKCNARIWLEVTEVRVERLRDITDQDAIAEGVDHVIDKIIGYCGYDYINGGYNLMTTPYVGFRSLWKKVNGEDSWKSNPWVWAISFNLLSTTGKPVKEIASTTIDN